TGITAGEEVVDAVFLFSAVPPGEHADQHEVQKDNGPIETGHGRVLHVVFYRVGPRAGCSLPCGPFRIAGGRLGAGRCSTYSSTNAKGSCRARSSLVFYSIPLFDRRSP